MSKLATKKTVNAQKRLDELKNEFKDLKMMMREQENRYISQIDELKEIVLTQTQIVKENSINIRTSIKYGSCGTYLI